MVPEPPATTSAAAAAPTAAAPTAAPGEPSPAVGAAADEYAPAERRWRGLRLVVLIVLVVAGLALLIAFFGEVRHWFALHTGILNAGPDKYYNFWSGFGSDLGEATLISAVAIGVYTGVRRVNCHSKGCWRIGHHALDGTPYILCRHHHPSVPTKGASHEHILEQHHKYKKAKEAREAREDQQG